MVLHCWADHHSHVHLAGPSILVLLTLYLDTNRYNKSWEVPGFHRSTWINPFFIASPPVLKWIVFIPWLDVDILTVLKFQFLLVQPVQPQFFPVLVNSPFSPDKSWKSPWSFKLGIILTILAILTILILQIVLHFCRFTISTHHFLGKSQEFTWTKAINEMISL